MDQRNNPLSPVAFMAPVEFAPKVDTAAPKRAFSGVAYGGGIITDHWMFDRVVFDLETTRLATPAPALYQHGTPVGVIRNAVIGGRIAIDGDLFADIHDDAKMIAEMADRGLPWQMSVGIFPGRVEDVRPGSKVSLNGQTFDGPLTVFRDNRVREVSFCAIGADGQTEAHVFALIGQSSHPRKDHSMEAIDRAEHDRIVADLTERLTTQTASTAAEKTRADQLEAQFATSRHAARTTAVKDLFQAIGQEYSDAAAKPYLEMEEATFAAVAADLRKRPARDPKLFSSQAKDGVQDDGTAPKTAQEFVAKAQAFVAEQAAAGVTITVADAVAHVRAKFAAAA